MNDGFTFTSKSKLVHFTIEPFADEQAMTLAGELEISISVLQKIARGLWDAIELEAL